MSRHKHVHRQNRRQMDMVKGGLLLATLTLVIVGGFVLSGQHGVVLKTNFFIACAENSNGMDCRIASE